MEELRLTLKCNIVIGLRHTMMYLELEQENVINENMICGDTSVDIFARNMAIVKPIGNDKSMEYDTLF